MKRKLVLAMAVAITITTVSGCGIFDKKDKENPTTTIVADKINDTESNDNNIGGISPDEMTSAAQEQETTHENISFENDVNTISNDKITWGVGVQLYDDNRPVAPVNLQNEYGSKYAVDWIREDEKVIYLTFDEGYENGYTSRILDTLKEKNVKAVFFITMPYAKSEQELVKRMIDEGHIVGSHSVTHPSEGMLSLSIEQQINEYKELHQYVLDTYGYEMWLFRPPTGTFSEQTLAVANYCGYRSVMWSFAYADWDPANQMEVGKALDNAVTKLHNGAVYLLHAVSQTNTEMLGDFIDKAREKGFEIKTY